jgi:hypothetical protein
VDFKNSDEIVVGLFLTRYKIEASAVFALTSYDLFEKINPTCSPNVKKHDFYVKNGAFFA